MCRETEKIGRCAFFLFNRLRLADKYMRAGFVRLWSSGSYFITAKAIPKSASRSQSPVIPLLQPLYERETVTVHGNTHISISPHVRARHTAPALLANRHSPPQAVLSAVRTPRWVQHRPLSRPQRTTKGCGHRLWKKFCQMSVDNRLSSQCRFPGSVGSKFRIIRSVPILAQSRHRGPDTDWTHGDFLRAYGLYSSGR